MARPSHVRDSVRELLEGSDRHDWSIEDLHAGILGNGLSADYSSVFRAVSWLEVSRARGERRMRHVDHRPPLRALKLLDEPAAGGEALVDGDDLAAGREHDRAGHG